MNKRRIYGLPNHWECPCGCGDYISDPLGAEVYRRQAQVLRDKDFMAGVREAQASVMRGEKPIPARDLKRKYVLDTREC